MICSSRPALLSAVWYTGDMCGAGMLISRPGHHTISWPVSPDRSISCISYPTISYLLSRLSPAWLQPRLSWLSSPEPLSSLVPAIELADILPRCCNHNVGENIERKVTNRHFYYCLNLCYKIWLFDEYLKESLVPLTLVTMSDPHSNLIAAQPTSDRVLISLNLIHHITILSLE